MHTASCAEICATYNVSGLTPPANCNVNVHFCSAMRTLGEADDESTIVWVQRLQAVEEEKEKAEKRVSVYIDHYE